MSTDIAVHQTSQLIIPKDVADAKDYAASLAQAGIVPQAFQRRPADILVAMDLAHSLNESLFVTMSEMSVVSGRPTFSAKFMRSRVRQAGHRLRETFDPETGTAKCVIIRHDDPDFEHITTWDKAKAEKHGLWGKGHWKKNPELMLKNRAVSECVREACYEVMGGIAYTTDEVLDFAPNRATAERVDEPRQEPRPAPAQEPSRQSATDRLAAQLGATTAPAQPDPAATLETWQALIAATNTIEELQQVYRDAYHHCGDAIIPAKDQRKHELSAATDSQPIDAELVDDTTAPTAA